MKLLGVALRGGGHPVTDAEVGALPVAEGLEPIATALGDLLAATFGDGSDPSRTPGEGGAQNPFPGAR